MSCAFTGSVKIAYDASIAVSIPFRDPISTVIIKMKLRSYLSYNITYFESNALVSMSVVGALLFSRHVRFFTQQRSIVQIICIVTHIHKYGSLKLIFSALSVF